jgi:hypothetical protein
MKPRMQPPTQDGRPWQEARALLDADPGYTTWSETGHAADALTFDEWLDTPEGLAWLDEEARYDAFKRNGYHPMESWDFEAIGA